MVGVCSDVPGAGGIAYAEKIGIPTAVVDFQMWRQENGVRRSDLEARKAFFAKMLAEVMTWQPEFIICSGLMLLVTDPFLSAFAGRMLNVHPALLSILTPDGKRKLTGLNVVARAMRAGDPTGSTVHIITAEPDMGPIVAESDPLPYGPGDDSETHQNLMKTACDGPAFRKALEKLIAGGWPEIPWQPD